MDSLDFHKKYDYSIAVYDSPEGLRVSFPKRIIKPTFDPCWYIYSVLNKDICGVNKFRVDTQESAAIDIPEYATRVAVYLDVLLECHCRKINTSLISCYDHNAKYHGGIKSVVDLLPKPTDINRENLLFCMVNDVIHSNERQKIDDDELNSAFDKLMNFILTGSFKI